MSGLLGAVSLLRPQRLVCESLRFNCPWHRSNFRPCYFPFNMKLKMKRGTVQVRLKDPNLRRLMLKNIIQEKPFIAYLHDSRKPERKLQWPL